MEDVAQLGMLLSCAIAIYVGARILWIWRSSRMVQELSIGINVLAIAVGAALLTAIGAMGGNARGVPVIPHVLGLLALAAHISALYLGNWKIFRGGERWPLPLMIVVHAALVAWMAMALLPERFEHISPLLYAGLRCSGMAWAAFECFRYSAMLRKRVALGLADPLVAHRIWLWGVGATAAFGISAVELRHFAVHHTALASTPFGLNLSAFVGFIGTVCIALAFFPPAAYLRLVGARAATRRA